MTRPQDAQWVGSEAGGFTSLPKLYSLVPYQAYIAGSMSARQRSHVCPSPGWRSWLWYAQSV